MKMPKDARNRRNQLFLLALVVVGIGVFVLFTNIDRAMLRKTLDETFTFVEKRACICTRLTPPTTASKA